MELKKKKVGIKKKKKKKKTLCAVGAVLLIIALRYCSTLMCDYAMLSHGVLTLWAAHLY